VTTVSLSQHKTSDDIPYVTDTSTGAAVCLILVTSLTVTQTTRPKVESESIWKDTPINVE
jgi:hypothetical protein